MKKITGELKAKLKEDMFLFATRLKNEGMLLHEIERTIQKYVSRKREIFYQGRSFYKISDPFSKIGNITREVLNRYSKTDSKAEYIFYQMLEENKIPFDYQVEIGPYRVDYLICNFLIFEGDGPHHKKQVEYDNKRDRYLEGMGYEVMRMSWDLVALLSDEIIQAIKKEAQKYSIIA